MKNEGRQIIEVNHLYLMEHSVLENIPRLAPDQLESLRESIARRGLMEPLDVVPNPEHEGAYLIIDGRHRFEILRKANQPIPCIVHAEKDPLDFAIDKAVQGRQLTKSGVVLMLFLNHPDLAQHRGKRTGGRPSNKGEAETGDSITSFGNLAKTYRVPKEYFVKLASIHDRCTDEEWEEVKNGIFQKDSAITALSAGKAGRDATKGKKRIDPRYERLTAKAVTTVTLAFQKWGHIDWNHKKKTQTEAWANAKAFEMFKAIPECLYEANISAIVETWKPHHKQLLVKAISTKGKK